MSADAATKLLIAPAARVLLLNAPIGYAKKLGPLPAGVIVTDKRGKADVVLAFIRDTGELKRLATSFGSLEEDAILWVCHPQGGRGGGSDLDHDVLRSAMAAHELHGTTEIVLDDAWVATRFSAPEDAAS